VWADRRLHVRAGDPRLGLVFAAWGVGALLAAVALPWLTRRYGPPRVALLALPASAVLSVATALCTSWLAGAVLTMVWGVAYMLVVTNAITFRQQVTPEALMSRVGTTGRMLSFGVGWPLGGVLGGVVAEAAGPVAGMLAGAAVLWMGAGYAWLSPLSTYPAG